MDNFLKDRSFIGILLISIISCTYLLKLDLIFFIFLIFFVFLEIYKNKFLNNLHFIFFIFNFLFCIFCIYQFDYFLNLILFLSILFLLSSFIFKNYLNFLFPYFVLFFLCAFFSFLINDRNIFYLIIFIAFLNDTTAYIFGNLFKGPKISKKISPNKTWSGTLISTLISTLILFFYNFNLFNAIVISSLLFYGDLYFSYIKRSFSIKDFSNILSSHGGILDRLDSMTITSIYILLINLYYV